MIKTIVAPPLTPPAMCVVLLDLSLVPELSELLPTTNTHSYNSDQQLYGCIPANLSPACPGLDHILCSTGKP